MTPPDRAALADLRARIKAATGPDREIDAALRIALFGWRKKAVPPDFDGQNAGWVWVPPEGLPDGYAYPNRGRIDPMFHARSYHPADKLDFTASLDAALALVERVLPGWKWTVIAYEPHEAPKPYGANVVQRDGDHDFNQLLAGIGPTPALALLAALMDAMEA